MDIYVIDEWSSGLSIAKQKSKQRVREEPLCGSSLFISHSLIHPFI